MQSWGRLRLVVTPRLPKAEPLGLGRSESREGLPESSAAKVSRLVGLQD